MKELLNKHIGKIFLGIVLLCFVVLSIMEYRGMHRAHTDLWNVSFVSPMGGEINIEVENGSPYTDFRYEVLMGKEAIGSGDLIVPTGEKRHVDINSVVDHNISLMGKIRIVVHGHLEEEREVFKIFPEE